GEGQHGLALALPVLLDVDLAAVAADARVALHLKTVPVEIDGERAALELLGAKQRVGRDIRQGAGALHTDLAGLRFVGKPQCNDSLEIAAATDRGRVDRNRRKLLQRGISSKSRQGVDGAYGAECGARGRAVRPSFGNAEAA